jgi:Na+/proline symporter
MAMRNHKLIACALAAFSRYVAGDACPAAQPVLGVMSNNPKFSGGCQVYKMGEGPCTSDSTPLSESVGWLVVVGFGFFFTLFTMFLSRYEYKTLGTAQSSEQFNTAGRNVGPGLTAAVIVSQWTWAATLLMSSNMGWRVGISGPFWYASGATIQILLFAILAIQVKRRASHMHTFMEIVKARFGSTTHIVMIIFALTTNVIVTSMLLLGGAATIEDLTGMSKLTAAFLIPILSCWIYTMYGGLRATFFASYIHTTVIFIMLLTFTFAVYSGNGEHDLWGSPSNVYNALQGATVHGFFDATYDECAINGNCGISSTPAPIAAAVDTSGCPTAALAPLTVASSYMTPTGFFDGLTGILLNDGECYNAKRENTGVKCGYTELGKDNPCCDIDYDTLKGGTYCRADKKKGCISTSAEKHFEAEGCGEGETCVTSFLTMGSTIGLIFGITNIVGNFGTVFVDQSYWQSAVAAKPKSAVLGFLIGGMVWFAVPFCMATTNGLAGRALTTHPDIDGRFGAYYIDGAASSNGLTPARVLSHILGPGGAFILLLQLFMAITSTGSAEIIAVSSILTYDIYYEYINPELKSRREKLRRIFYTIAQKYAGIVGGVDVVQNPDQELRVRLELTEKSINTSDVQSLLNDLSKNGFFDVQPSDDEVKTLSSLVATFASEAGILVPDLYSAVNKAVSSNNIEGMILLRTSKFFTGLFAVFMGFLAVFLLTIGLSLGHVYMSMGCLVGSAVGPAALTILMETANSKAIAAGAIGGFILAMIGWVGQAASEFGEVKYGTIMSDWPWVSGNLCGILGGTAIAWLGSLIAPDKDFRWSMLNERIALVDDVEPPKDSKLENDDRLAVQVKIAVWASIGLTILLLVLWPIPMHVGTGVLSEGGFGAWVGLEIIWALLGAIIIIIMPLIELIRTFTGKDKAVFKSGDALKIDIKAGGLQGVVPTSEPTRVKA